ncbi:hypothetical protein ACJIZ3_016471 [Penstemon smallii]|uniref:HMA domain-containing protein n=1 Tax=Penstemon smallii TaxID=265156 RepID=A0ABD3RQQ8_9LAMI
MAKLEEKKTEVITAVYKAYLHCPKCAHDIQKPLLSIPGVHSVDVKSDKGEITVKGAVDAKLVHARLQKWSKKKVEFISETKSKETIKTITMKAYLHCDQCEREVRKRLLLHKGIHNLKTDIKAQTITVEGVIESEKLIAYMRKKVHKYAEIIIPPIPKETKKEELKKETVVKVVEVKSGGDKAVEFKEVKKVEVKTKEGEAPYFIHYVYAPQLFSDENPNACSIM